MVGTPILREVEGLTFRYRLLDFGRSSDVIVPAGENENALIISLSPDRTILAMMQATFDGNVLEHKVLIDPPLTLISQELVLLSYDGSVISETAWQDRWSTLLGWLDGGRVVISRLAPYVVFFDPFSKQWEEFAQGFSDPYRPETGPPWPWYTPYAPDGQFVVYEPRDLSAYAIWDLGANVGGARVSFDEVLFHAPAWAPDGSTFVVAGAPVVPDDPFEDRADDELYAVNRGGEVTRLTDLASAVGHGVDIGSYSWSPDGRRIAFWVTFDPDQTSRRELAVVDVGSGRVTRYCLDHHPDVEEAAPIWSPDGEQLKVVTVYSSQRWAAVVDLERGIAIPVLENVTPIGWMAGGPIQ